MTAGDTGGRAQDGDSALAARARGGDAAAFDELYRRHRDQMYTLCLNMCGDREQAKDLLQETFVRAWRAIGKFAGRSSFTTWLYRIAVNVCRDAARRQRRRPRPAPNAPEPDLATVDRVRDALSRLRRPHHLALVLRYSLSLSHREIADLLGWSLPKVKVTIHRARAAFKDAYADGEGEQ